jgi:hypothetical protein
MTSLALAPRSPIEAFALVGAQSFDFGSPIRVGAIEHAKDGRASFTVDGIANGEFARCEVVVPASAVAMFAFLVWCTALEWAGCTLFWNTDHTE